MFLSALNVKAIRSRLLHTIVAKVIHTIKIGQDDMGTELRSPLLPLICPFLIHQSGIVFDCIHYSYVLNRFVPKPLWTNTVKIVKFYCLKNSPLVPSLPLVDKTIHAIRSLAVIYLSVLSRSCRKQRQLKSR